MRRRDGSLARIPGGVTARRRGSTPPPPSSTSPAAQLQRSSSSSRRPTAVPSFLAWTSSTETPSSPTTAATTPRTRNLKKRRMIPKQTNTQKWTPPGAGNLENISDALHAETLALLNVLNATAKMGFNQVIFEMDSAVLKQAISSEDYDLAPLGALFQEIKFQLRVAFENVNLYVCHRSCNNAVHVLAAHGASLGDGKYEIWLGQFPELVLNSVAGDLTSRSL